MIVKIYLYFRAQLEVSSYMAGWQEYNKVTCIQLCKTSLGDKRKTVKGNVCYFISDMKPIKQITSSLFWVDMQHAVVAVYRCFRTAYWSHLQGPSSLCYPKTLVNKYKKMLWINPEKQTPHLHCSKSPKSHAEHNNTPTEIIHRKITNVTLVSWRKGMDTYK